MTEIRIRVRPIVKEKLKEFKEKTGLSINYLVNWALVKFMVTEGIIKLWEYESNPNSPHYAEMNKLPEDMKEVDR